MKTWLFLVVWWCVTGLSAQENWQEALRKMPLKDHTALNRDNCQSLLLGAFQSNNLVKAMVFLPGVSDDFYLINRDQPKLDLKADNLLSAIVALTNATKVRVSFMPPLLLLHLDRDPVEPSLIVKDKSTAQRLKAQSHFPHALWIDAHWQRMQPLLQAPLKMKVLPPASSGDAWHFARHNLRLWGLSDWELLEALSLADKTTISVQKARLVFQARQAP